MYIDITVIYTIEHNISNNTAIFVIFFRDVIYSLFSHVMLIL